MTVKSGSLTPQCTVGVYKELPVSRGFPTVIMRFSVGFQKFTVHFLLFFESLKLTGHVFPTLFQVHYSLTLQAC